MQFADNDYNEYFIAMFNDTNVNCGLITYNKGLYNGLKEGSTFKDYLKNYNFFDLTENYGIVDVYGNHNGGETETNFGYGYVMQESWKHEMIDYIVDKMDVDDIETYIAEIGIRKAITIADECEFYDEEEKDCMREVIMTDQGIKRLFSAIMWSFIELAEGVQELEKDEYERIIEENAVNVDEENEEQDDDLIERISSAVAPCA